MSFSWASQPTKPTSSAASWCQRDLPHAVPEHSWAPVPAFVPDCSKFLSPREMTQGFCTSFQRAFFYLPFCSLQRLLFTHFLPQLALGREQEAKCLHEIGWSHCALPRVCSWHFCSQSNQSWRSLEASISNHPKSACFSAQLAETPLSRGCQ